MRKVLCNLLCFGHIFTFAACNSASNEINSQPVPSESVKSTNSPIPTEGTPVPIRKPAVSPSHSAPGEPKNKSSTDNGKISIHITVGSTTFTATLHDNETTQALVAQFPLSLKMSELNGLEKFYDLPKNLPAKSTERPATIYAGDIMSWSGNTLVLFYKTYTNSYGGYVPLGRIDDPTNLASALGSDNVKVTWSLAD